MPATPSHFILTSPWIHLIRRKCRLRFRFNYFQVSWALLNEVERDNSDNLGKNVQQSFSTGLNKPAGLVYFEDFQDGATYNLQADSTMVSWEDQERVLEAVLSLFDYRKSATSSDPSPFSFPQQRDVSIFRATFKLPILENKSASRWNSGIFGSTSTKNINTRKFLLYFGAKYSSSREGAKPRELLPFLLQYSLI